MLTHNVALFATLLGTPYLYRAMDNRRAPKLRRDVELENAKRLNREADRQAISSGMATREQIQRQNRIIDGSKVRIDYSRVPMPR